MPQLPAPDYPADVRARLEADAREIIARYPDSRSALLPLLHLVQSEEGHVTRTGHAVLRRHAGPDHGRGHRGRHLLHHVPAQALRRLPGGRLHQHPVRGDGRRRHLRGAPGAPRRRQRRDHRGRQGHPGAHRVQRGLRLRARRDGQLGVLRQPDPGQRQAPRRRPARGRAGRAHPRRPAVHVQGDRPHPGRLPRRAARAPSRRAAARAPPRWSGCGWPRARAPARVVAPRGGGAAESAPPHEPSPAEHLSSHDAPQDTAASDPAHPAGPVAEEGE